MSNISRVLTPESYNDVHILVTALGLAVQAGILSREQATYVLKDQLYESGILKRSAVPPKIESEKKEKVVK